MDQAEASEPPDDLEDRDEQEASHEVEDLAGYCGEEDELDCVRMQIKNTEEKHCWPNQECLSEEILKRIRFSFMENQGIDIDDYYEIFDYQVSEILVVFVFVKKI